MPGQEGMCQEGELQLCVKGKPRQVLHKPEHTETRVSRVAYGEKSEESGIYLQFVFLMEERGVKLVVATVKGKG